MSEIDEFGDEETLAEMAERYGRRAVVAEAEVTRLRAKLEAVRDQAAKDPYDGIACGNIAIAAPDEEGT